MEYDLLTQDEMDEMVVSFHRAQQRDHFLHTLNLARYDDMLTTMPAEAILSAKQLAQTPPDTLTPEQKWAARVQGLRAETAERLMEVESIMMATEKQLPAPARRAAVLGQVLAKEQAAQPPGAGA